MPHKLLLADDSVTIQRVIELTFADEDVQVIAVGNGQQAIDHAQRDRPDIVLADVGMPERDGYEVAAFIKGNPALSHVPVVLLTGAFEPIDETRARAVGCDGVLVKPFEPQMVISRVKDLLAGRRPAGLWGSGPSAQGPVRQPAGDLDLRSASQGGATDPLEAYFDRLDAAFSSIGSGSTPEAPPVIPAPPAAAPTALPKREPIPLSKPAAPPAGQRPADGLDSWDPELAGDPPRTTPPRVEPRPAVPTPVSAAPVSAVPPAAPATAPAAVPSTALTPSMAPLSLVDAFAALLAAEQRTSIAPSAAPSWSIGAIDEQLIDQVTERVLSRLSDQARPSILDVAERLVRDEIERIKANR
jgi:CheY-like chemotaxis protein